MIAPHFDLIYLYSWAVVLLLFFLSGAFVLFAAYFRLDQMEEHFIASYVVGINRRILGNGPFGRMRRVREIGTLTGRLTHVQMLDLHAVMEAETFPEHLKKWLRIPGYLFQFGVTGAALLLLWLGIGWICVTVSRPANDLQLLGIAGLVACLFLGLMAAFAKVWVSFFRLAEIESLLKKSYFVARNQRVLGNGAYGRYCRLSHISHMLLMDDDFLSKSDPYAMDEIAGFPSHLRRLVVIPARILAYSFLGYLVIHLGGKAFGVFT